MGYVLHAILFYQFCPCQELRPFLKEEDIRRGIKKRELAELRRNYIQGKSFNVIEMWEFEGWRLYKTTANVEQHMRQSFPYGQSLTEHQFLEGIKNGNLFGYVQCEIEVQESLRANFANFSLIFKSTLVSKTDIGDLMKTFVEEKRIMSQPRKLFKSSFTLQNGTLITPLLLFYPQLGLAVTKIHRSVEYTPRNLSTALYRQQWT